VRLRLLEQRKCFIAALKNTAIIRDFHVFGQLVAISEIDTLPKRHQSLGQKLIKEAEKIAIENGYKKIAFTCGIGLRRYFNELGYELKSSYMIKQLL
jgi:elongator complex protein 3